MSVSLHPGTWRAVGNLLRPKLNFKARNQASGSGERHNVFQECPRVCPWALQYSLAVSEGLKEEWELSRSRRQLKLAQAKASIMRVLRHQSPETHERMDYVFSRKKRDLSSPAPRAKVTLAMELPLQGMTPGLSLGCWERLGLS